MPLRVMCWNIQRLNMDLAGGWRQEIVAMSLYHKVDINIFLENKTRTGEVVNALLEEFFNQDSTCKWDCNFAYCGGTEYRYEFIIYIWNDRAIAKIEPFPIVEWISHFTPNSFGNESNHLKVTYPSKRGSPYSFESALRLPMGFTVTLTSSGTLVRIAAFHAPGPQAHASTEIPSTGRVVDEVMSKLTSTVESGRRRAASAHVDILMGDFNIGGSKDDYVHEFTDPPGTKYFPLQWVGWDDSRSPTGRPFPQSTTIKMSSGPPFELTTGSPYDRLYVRGQYKTNVTVGYGLYPAYIGQFTDHVPVFAEIYLPGTVPLEEKLISRSQLPAFTPPVALPTKITLLAAEQPTLAQLVDQINNEIEAKNSFVLNDAVLHTQGLDAWMKVSLELGDATSLTVSCSVAIPVPPKSPVVIDKVTCNVLKQASLITKVTLVGNESGHLTSFTVDFTCPDNFKLSDAFQEMKTERSLGTVIFPTAVFQLTVDLTSPTLTINPDLRFSGQLPLDEKSPCGWVQSFWQMGSSGEPPVLPSPSPSPLPVSGPIAYYSTAKAPYRTVDLRNDDRAPLGKKELKMPWDSGSSTSLRFEPTLRAIYNGQNDVERMARLSMPGAKEIKKVEKTKEAKEAKGEECLLPSGFYLQGSLYVKQAFSLFTTLTQMGGGVPGAKQQMSPFYLLTFGGAQQPVASFDQLQGLLGNYNWEPVNKLIPKSILEKIRLQYVALVLQPSGPLVPWVELEVVTLPWKLFKVKDQWITLEPLSLRLTASAPYKPDDYTLNISSNISWDDKLDFAMNITLEAPSVSISGLATFYDSTLNFTDAVTRLTEEKLPALPAEVLSLKLDQIMMQMDYASSEGSSVKKYTCDIMGAITLFDINFQDINCSVTYDSSAAPPDRLSLQLTGQILFCSVAFDVACNLTGGEKSLALRWDGKSFLGFTLNNILQKFVSDWTLPDELNFSLQKAAFTYSFASPNASPRSLSLSATLDIDGQEVNTVLCVFDSVPPPTSGPQQLLADKVTHTVLLVDIQPPASLGSLPVVGNIPSPLSLLQLVVSCHPLSVADVTSFNQQAEASNPNVRPLPVPAKDAPFPQGITLCLTLLGVAQPVLLPLSKAPPRKPSADGQMPLESKSAISPRKRSDAEDSKLLTPSVALTGEVSDDDVPPLPLWITLSKTFGPLTVQRIGLSYQQQKLCLLLDANFKLGPLTVQALGLGVGIPLDTPKQLDKWSFNLDGLGLAYHTGPLSLAGSFVLDKTQLPPDVSIRYDGTALLNIENLMIAALGSYAKFTPDYQKQTGQDCSIFVFARVNYPFGGPPFFFVTGFAGGFGYNQRLVIPSPDQVTVFPLVQGSVDPAALAGGGGDLTAIEGQLLGKEGSPGWIIPQAGENWLAVGLNFTTYEVLGTQALAIAEWGQDLQFALVGRSIMNLPKQGTSIVYIEMDLEAVFNPSQGFLGMTALISPNSYVLAPECHLSGGFAFNAWMKNQDTGASAGDFVVTMGGYHPSFQPPAWYPKIPRLGFSWQVDHTVDIHGEAYFAITPSAAMAGGLLNVLFHSGNLKAWLKTGADFLLEWHPFQYAADIGVSVGVSYHMNYFFGSTDLRVSIGATLSLAGPPTHGKAHIDWYIISFDIPFGPHPEEPKIDWPTFCRFLPQDPASKFPVVHRVLPTQGLIKTLTDKPDSKAITGRDPTSQSDQRWIVRPSEFTFSTESVIPLTSVQVNSVPIGGSFLGPLYIKPMKKPITSQHQVTILKETSSGLGLLSISDQWQYDIQKRNVPDALWGKPNDLQAPDAKLLPDYWTGLKAQAPLAAAQNKLGPVDAKDAFGGAVRVGQIGFLPWSIQHDVGASVPQKDEAKGVPTIADPDKGIASRGAIEQRGQLLAGLETIGLFAAPKTLTPTSSMTRFAELMAGRQQKTLVIKPSH